MGGVVDFSGAAKSLEEALCLGAVDGVDKSCGCGFVGVGGKASVGISVVDRIAVGVGVEVER